jgi:O-antigen ligase
VSAVDALRPRRFEAPESLAPALAAGSLLVLLALTFALALYRFPPSWEVVLAASVGMTGVLALAIVRYEAAVTLGFLLFGVVAVEPAPADGVFAVVIAVALVTGRFDVARVPLTVFALLGAFIGLNVLSAVEVLDVGAAARYMAITAYLAVFSVWFSSYLNSERRARAVVRAYVGPAALMALAASAALFLPVPGGGLLLRYDATRATGLFEDPNVFGPFLVPAAVILLHEMLDPRLLRSPRAVKLALFLMLTGGVVFSYSRAAWINYSLAVLVLMGVMALRRGGGRRAVAVLGLLMVAAVGVVGTIAVTGSLDFLQERAQFQSYDLERFGAQRTGIGLAERYPFGIGPGQFDVVQPLSTHSTYVRALAEQGVLGLFAMLALILVTLVFAVRNAVLGRDSYGIGSAALLGAWVGIVANSFVVDTLHWRHLWFVAALVWVGAMRPPPEAATSTAAPPR